MNPLRRRRQLPPDPLFPSTFLLPCEGILLPLVGHGGSLEVDQQYRTHTDRNRGVQDLVLEEDQERGLTDMTQDHLAYTFLLVLCQDPLGLDQNLQGEDQGFLSLDQGIQGLDQDIQGLVQDLQGLDQDLQGLDQDLQGLEQGLD